MTNAAHSHHISQSLNLENNQFNSKQTTEFFEDKQLNGRSISLSMTENKLKETSEKTNILYETFQEQSSQNLEENFVNIRGKDSDSIATIEKETSQTNILTDQMINRFTNLGFSVTEKAKLIEDTAGLLQQLNNIAESSQSSEEKLEQVAQLQNKFIDKLANEGQIYKPGPNGEKLPLTEADKELLKQEFKSIFKEYIANHLPTLQAQKPESPQNQAEESGNKTHIAVIIDPRHPQPSIEVKIPNILVIELFTRSITQNLIQNIAKKSEQARAEEKKEQALLDLIDRIKHDVLKKDLLNREIVKDDIKLQELKDRTNKYIEVPVEDLTRISQVYGNVEKGKTLAGGKIRLRLPGIHKMKPLSAA